ncbi:hypothetical protein OG216_24015 [Streptomycetaceae bacterium NBC_01309]
MVERCECQRPLTAVGWAADGSLRQVQIRCGNRRASQCPSCSKLYRDDAARLIRTGALDRVTGSAFAFVTLTAPSFGAVHRVPKTAAKARPGAKVARKRCGCGRVHSPGDPLRGVPIDWTTYDYAGQAHFNRDSGKLWHATLEAWSRLLGARPEYVVVREWQARGAIHLHVLLRLTFALSGQHETDALRSGLGEVARSVSSRALDHGSGDVRRITWGQQVDVQIVDPARRGRGHAKVVAGYLGKLTTYAAKDLTGDLPSSESAAPARAHHAELTETAEQMWCSAKCDRVGECSGRAHKGWGFRGHVLTQSRMGRIDEETGEVGKLGWSGLTFAELRNARRAHVRSNMPDDESAPLAWAVLGQEFRGDADELRRVLLAAGADAPPWVAAMLAAVDRS